MKTKYYIEQRWPCKKSHSDSMRKFKGYNLEKCEINKNENWFRDKLDEASVRYTRQACLGYRIFDFWCAEKGVAFEVDGASHNTEKDYKSDAYMLCRSGIVVLRIRNMNEEDAALALRRFENLESWRDRRIKMGLFKTPVNIRRRFLTGRVDVYGAATAAGLDFPYPIQFISP